MVASVKTSGTKLTVIGTPHDLGTILDPGTYQLVVDTSPLLDGDTLELTVYGKARPTDAEFAMWGGSFKRSSKPLVPGIPVVSPHHFRAELKQTTGAARTFIWAVYQL